MKKTLTASYLKYKIHKMPSWLSVLVREVSSSLFFKGGGKADAKRVLQSLLVDGMKKLSLVVIGSTNNFFKQDGKIWAILLLSELTNFVGRILKNMHCSDSHLGLPHLRFVPPEWTASLWPRYGTFCPARCPGTQQRHRSPLPHSSTSVTTRSPPPSPAKSASGQ